MISKPDLSLHKRYLILLLSEITKNIPTQLAFKGGTCAYLFYNLSRFSFDLDFDVLKELGKYELDKFQEILNKTGRIREFYEKQNTIFALFNYQQGSLNIKIEFNKRIWEYNKYKEHWFLGIPMIIQDETTMITNKMVAITDRKTAVARDLFDLHFFLKLGFQINRDLVKERTAKEAADYLKYLKKYISQKYNERNILQGLGEALDDKQKTWVKKYLIVETLQELDKLLR